jgi:aryl-alcohol dehydrogenase-like predicted oxidoreductase
MTERRWFGAVKSSGCFMKFQGDSAPRVALFRYRTVSLPSLEFRRAVCYLRMMHKQNRREFLAVTARGAAAAAVLPSLDCLAATGDAIPTRPFGKTGVKVSILGVGGWHIGIQKEKSESIRLIQTAMDAGVNFLDNSIDYNEGQSELRMGEAIKGRRDQVFLMTKHNFRDRKSALRDLEISLKRLQTDHLDLWQFHSIERPEDPDWIFEKNGAIEAAELARKQGKIRFIGFTGHKNPDYHLKMLAKSFAWDAIQMPLNVLDSHFRSFERNVLPEAVKRQLGIVGMKPMAFQNAPLTGAITSTECLQYAMSLPVSVTITGCETMERLETALKAARSFKPLGAAEMQALRDRMKTFVKDGKSEPYKITTDFDNKPAAFPPPYEA